MLADLRRGTGATVISAAGGAEYALESARWNNGAFTYCLRQGLEEGRADADKNGAILTSELRDFVTRSVYEMTAGRQRPTVRRENLESDFVLK
jgi:hypothetical protein